MDKDKQIKKLRKENKELKETLSILSNRKLIEKLVNALKDLKEGRYTIK